jgi:hypothetical protein
MKRLTAKLLRRLIELTMIAASGFFLVILCPILGFEKLLNWIDKNE